MNTLAKTTSSNELTTRPKSIKERLFWIIRHGNQHDIKREYNYVMSDSEQLIQLVGQKTADDKWNALLRQCEREANPRVATVEPAWTPDDIPVQAHSRSKPSISLEATQAAKTSSAIRMLTHMHGIPLTEWSVGQCRTERKKKLKEGWMLDIIIRKIGHVADDGDDVGKYLSMDDIENFAKEVLAKNK